MMSKSRAIIISLAFLAGSNAGNVMAATKNVCHGESQHALPVQMGHQHMLVINVEAMMRAEKQFLLNGKSKRFSHYQKPILIGKDTCQLEVSGFNQSTVQM